RLGALLLGDSATTPEALERLLEGLSLDLGDALPRIMAPWRRRQPRERIEGIALDTRHIPKIWIVNDGIDVRTHRLRRARRLWQRSLRLSECFSAFSCRCLRLFASSSAQSCATRDRRCLPGLRIEPERLIADGLELEPATLGPLPHHVAV